MNDYWYDRREPRRINWASAGLNGAVLIAGVALGFIAWLTL